MDSQTMILSIFFIFIALALLVLWIGLILKTPHKKKLKKIEDIDGELIINTSDPHKDVLRFELYYDPGVLLREQEKEYIRFRIVHEK